MIEAEVLRRAREKILRGNLDGITLEDVEEASRIQEHHELYAERLLKLTDEELKILNEIT